ncbi:Lysine-specific demethylase 8 [Physocladia obscura]|uniref:Lysine-specific demethylase 8 n=1 Tax=Physocladia obscura TaxID=109957 RepID=A0AAD5SW83_9FUNG|nr:Lysine-specific demethylase 8 [Physocladia obscura]
MPVDMEHLVPPVRRALLRANNLVRQAHSAVAQRFRHRVRTALALAAIAACDKAREATFPFLASPTTPKNSNNNASYTNAYAAASILFAVATLQRLVLVPSTKSSSAQRNTTALAALRALDLAMLRAGTVLWGPIAAPFVNRASEIIAEGKVNPAVIPQLKNSKKKKSSESDNCNSLFLPANLRHLFLNPHSREIPRIDARTLSVADFRDRFMVNQPDDVPLPVILTHAIDSWPAIARWKEPDYLVGVAGDRLVPIETYARKDSHLSFLSKTWSHRVVTFDEYIRHYVFQQQKPNDKDEQAYLAQHPLFEQIPALRNDIGVPEFCSARTPQDDATPFDCEARMNPASPLVSAWFGPAGTVSPLHNDPYHNLLAQIVGSKFLRIYDARNTARVYPQRSYLGQNSRVDVEHVDEKMYPLFNTTPCWQCVLKEGELLYIPRHAWHYVRSLEASFSASFWFGAKMDFVEVDKKGVYQAQYLKKGESNSIQ